MKMNALELRVKTLLTLQAALLGRVTRGMNLIMVSWDEEKISIRIIFGEKLSLVDLRMIEEIKNFVIYEMPEFHVSSHPEIALSLHMVRRGDGDVSVFRRSL
jgi:UPF0288 family protein (methanogenesis marker protein 3)